VYFITHLALYSDSVATQILNMPSVKQALSEVCSRRSGHPVHIYSILIWICVPKVPTDVNLQESGTSKRNSRNRKLFHIFRNILFPCFQIIMSGHNNKQWIILLKAEFCFSKLLKANLKISSLLRRFASRLLNASTANRTSFKQFHNIPLTTSVRPTAVAKQILSDLGF
jgi:hypothetical protein